MTEDKLYHEKCRLISNGEVVARSNGGHADHRRADVISWSTGWTDRNGDEVYGGDILKRVRDRAVESEREWLEENEDAPTVDDIESFVNDYSGAVGVVEWREGGYHIKNLKGHKWAFHGPEGHLDFDWETEVEIIGNIWENKDLINDLT